MGNEMLLRDDQPSINILCLNVDILSLSCKDGDSQGEEKERMASYCLINVFLYYIIADFIEY